MKPLTLAALATHPALIDMLTQPSLAVPRYLMSVWLYDRGTPVLSDAAFDDMCRFIDDWWDDISHPHKHLIRRESLAACTTVGYDLRSWPKRIVGGALAWWRITC